jgi:hypothetical protein
MVTQTERSVWRVPAYLPYLQPALTSAAVSDAEVQLGVRLPQAYLRMLFQQNGGYLRLGLQDWPSEMVWGIGPHFPSILDTIDWKDAGQRSEYGWLPHNPKLLVPFDGDGHWHLCFDYRRSGSSAEPGVTYIDFEREQEDVIAIDFGEFLASLQLCGENAVFGIRSELTEVASVLEGELRISFESQGTFAHGYETKRAGLGADGRAPWIWVSENNVPRGFVRATDPRYRDLVGLFEGTALRFPENPASKTIVQCNGAASPAVVHACSNRGLEFEVIHEGAD